MYLDQFRLSRFFNVEITAVGRYRYKVIFLMPTNSNASVLKIHAKFRIKNVIDTLVVSSRITYTRDIYMIQRTFGKLRYA